MYIHFYKAYNFYANKKLIQNMVFYKNVVYEYLEVRKTTTQLIKKNEHRLLRDYLH